MTDLPGDALRWTLEGGTPRSYRTGLRGVDSITDGGLRAGEVSVVAAATGMGKTAFVEQIALSMSIEHEVLFMPLEMGQRDTLIRMAAKIARCSFADFVRTGLDRMTERELNVRQLCFFEPKFGQGLYVDDVLNTIANYRCPVVMLDHVRHIEGWLGDTKSPHVGPSNIVRRLREGARELNVHIVLCAQLNRMGYGKRPQLQNIQDTSALEQLASLVVLLHRPFYHQGSYRDTVTELIVAKNRYGPMCKIHYRWVGPTMSVWEMSADEQKQVECCGRRGASGVDAPAVPVVRDRDDVAEADEGGPSGRLFSDEG